MVHRLRRWSDAVLVGRSTVQIDDCTLTVRRGVELPPGKAQPVRVIIDPDCQLDYRNYRIVTDGLPTLIICKENILENKDMEEFPNAKLVRIPRP